MSKLIRVLIVLVMALSLPMTTAFAHNGHGKDSLVALGDSIPFGFDPRENNEQPAKHAYPYLIGDKADVKVRNLGVPGWKTTELLTALQHNKKFRQAVKRADYVTIHIGSNDFLEVLRAAGAESGGDNALFHRLFQQKLANSPVFDNLESIIEEVRSLTRARIVLYNVYNPFPLNDPLHQVSDMYLPQINDAYQDLADSSKKVKLADAYSAFGDKQAKYLIPGDVHPSKAGHSKLAKIGEKALYRAYAYH